MSKKTVTNDIQGTPCAGNPQSPQPKVVKDDASTDVGLSTIELHAQKAGVEAPVELCVPLENNESAVSNPLKQQDAGCPRDHNSPAGGVSDRKLVANRANAKLSTGPRTLVGKATSARNSYKHGILASIVVPSSDSSRPAFEDLLDAIAEDYQAVGYVENFLVEKIAVETFRLRRLLAAELQEFNRKEAFFGPAVDRVLRYQTAINRQLFDAMKQLEELQGRRK